MKHLCTRDQPMSRKRSEFFTLFSRKRKTQKCRYSFFFFFFFFSPAPPPIITWTLKTTTPPSFPSWVGQPPRSVNFFFSFFLSFQQGARDRLPFTGRMVIFVFATGFINKPNNNQKGGPHFYLFGEGGCATPLSVFISPRVPPSVFDIERGRAWGLE